MPCKVCIHAYTHVCTQPRGDSLFRILRHHQSREKSHKTHVCGVRDLTITREEKNLKAIDSRWLRRHHKVLLCHLSASQHRLLHVCLLSVLTTEAFSTALGQGLSGRPPQPPNCFAMQQPARLEKAHSYHGKPFSRMGVPTIPHNRPELYILSQGKKVGRGGRERRLRCSSSSSSSPPAPPNPWIGSPFFLGFRSPGTMTKRNRESMC